MTKEDWRQFKGIWKDKAKRKSCGWWDYNIHTKIERTKKTRNNFKKLKFIDLEEVYWDERKNVHSDRWHWD